MSITKAQARATSTTLNIVRMLLLMVIFTGQSISAAAMPCIAMILGHDKKTAPVVVDSRALHHRKDESAIHSKSVVDHGGMNHCGTSSENVINTDLTADHSAHSTQLDGQDINRCCSDDGACSMFGCVSLVASISQFSLKSPHLEASPYMELSAFFPLARLSSLFRPPILG